MSIEALAGQQHGLVTHDQAIGFGLSTKQVQGRVASGRWVRVVRGLYRMGGAPVTSHQQALAACLAGPDPTRASHLTAAALLGLGRFPMLPHVTVPPTASCRLPIARVHRAEVVSTECVRLFGIPCTATGRTIADSAALLDERALARMVDDALCRGLTTVSGIDLDDGRRGIRRLRSVLEPWTGDIAPGSPAEMRLQRQLVAWGYPMPVRQHEVRDETGRLIGKLDLAWPHGRIGLEYDSDRWHNPRHWRHDESRHTAIVRRSWTVLHPDKADLRAGDRRFRAELERVWDSIVRQPPCEGVSRTLGMAG